MDPLVARYQQYFRHPDDAHDILDVGDRAIACINVRRALEMLGLTLADVPREDELYDEQESGPSNRGRGRGGSLRRDRRHEDDEYDDEDEIVHTAARGRRRDDPTDDRPGPATTHHQERLGRRGDADSTVRSITRDSTVSYLTRDNLALAPEPEVMPEPPAAPEHRYQITTLHPTTYREARTIGEHFREGTPVIMNLTEMDEADARRLVDFGAGLAFGLRGTMERVTNRVFLLSPANVQVTPEDKAKIAEGGFLRRR